MKLLHRFSLKCIVRSVFIWQVCTRLVWAQELITNGSFEDTASASALDAAGTLSLTPGATNLPGWTIINAELVWANNTNRYGLTTPYGSYLLDLTGYHDSSPYGGVMQTIATQPNTPYRFSCSLGVSLDNPAYRGPVSAMVVVGSTTNSFTFTVPDAGNQWMTFDIDFVATGEMTPLTIVGAQSGGGQYIGLDNVSLKANAAGPEMLVNGSFEDLNGTFMSSSGIMSLPINSTNIPGWATMNAELAWSANNNPYGPKTPYGSLFLDLTGFHDSAPYGGVTQTVATTPNQPYHLSLAVGTDQDQGGFSGPAAVSVIVGSVSNLFTFTPPQAPTGNLWMTFSVDFTAQATATPVMVVGTAAGGGQYLGLDNISVVPAVSGPQILTVEKLGNDLRLSFTSQAGKNYAVQSRSDFTSGIWTTLTGISYQGNGSIAQAVLTNVVNPSAQFFRLQQTP